MPEKPTATCKACDKEMELATGSLMTSIRPLGLLRCGCKKRVLVYRAKPIDQSEDPSKHTFKVWSDQFAGVCNISKLATDLAAKKGLQIVSAG